jgi:hypothetical protein
MMEVGVIRRIPKKAKRWHIVADEIRPLKECLSVGKALAHEEKVKLLRMAASARRASFKRLRDGGKEHWLRHKQSHKCHNSRRVETASY